MNDIETFSMKDVMVVLYDGWNCNGLYCFYHQRFFCVTSYGEEGVAIKGLYSKIAAIPQSKFYIFDIEESDMDEFDIEMADQFKRGEDIDLNHFMEFVEKYSLIPTVIEK